MNTPTIAAVLSQAPRGAEANARTSESAAGDASPFANILQQAETEQVHDAAARVNEKHSSAAEKQALDAEKQARELAAEEARLAALPELALSIAAQLPNPPGGRHISAMTAQEGAALPGGPVRVLPKEASLLSGSAQALEGVEAPRLGTVQEALNGHTPGQDRQKAVFLNAQSADNRAELPGRFAQTELEAHAAGRFQLQAAASESPQRPSIHSGLAATQDGSRDPTWVADQTEAVSSPRSPNTRGLDMAALAATHSDNRAGPQAVATHTLSNDLAGTISSSATESVGGLAPAQSAAFISTPAATSTATVHTPLQHAEWGKDFSRQLISFTEGRTGLQTVELRLDPPDLGPLRITLQISDNVAHAAFASAHASVRQAVENALPQLAQQLAQTGISLGQTNVGDQGQAQFAFNGSEDGSAKQSAGGKQSGSDAGGHDVHTAQQGRAGRAPVPDALVDTFA